MKQFIQKHSVLIMAIEIAIFLLIIIYGRV